MSAGYRTLIAHWNGASWTVVASPNQGQDNVLYKLAALGASDIWATGNYYSNGVNQTLVEHWNGTAWTLIASPDQGHESNDLFAVTAVTADDIWAVGQYDDNGNQDWRTLVEHYSEPCPTPTPAPCAYLLDEGFEDGFGAFVAGGDQPWGLQGPGGAHEGLYQADIEFEGPTEPPPRDGGATHTPIPTPGQESAWPSRPLGEQAPSSADPPPQPIVIPADGYEGWLRTDRTDHDPRECSAG